MKRRVMAAVLIGFAAMALIVTVVGGVVNYRYQKARFHDLGRQNASLGARMIEHVLEKSVANGIFELVEIFDDLYEPIPGTDPPRFHTAYDRYLDRNLRTLQEAFLQAEPIYYAYAVNRDGFVPVHNDPDRNGFLLAPPTPFPREDPSFACRSRAGEDGYGYQEYASPIFVRQRRWGEFRVGVPNNIIRALVRERVATASGLIVGLSMLLASVVLLVVRRSLRPLTELSEAARRMGEGDLNVRSSYRSDDELGNLSELFNSMADRIQASYQLLEMRVEERTRELRRANAALRGQENQLRGLFHAVQDGLVIFNREGRIEEANPAAGVIFGRDPETLSGMSGWDLLGPGGYDIFRRFRERLSQGGDFVSESPQLFRKDAAFNVEVRGTAYEVDGEQRFLGYFRDITDRRRAEKALHSAMEAARAASRAKSEFLANMSHEIRTPMNGIIGMTELVLETDITEQQREYVELVQSSALALLNVLNDLLDYSKIEAGHLELEQIEFRLQAVLQKAILPLAMTAEEKGLEVICQISPAVPDTLLGDPGRLRQILVNLVGNAVKFTEAGEVVIRVESEGTQEGKIRLHFQVTDTGIGIPSDRVGAIFGAFTQADGSTTRRYGGTGLGTSISKQLVEMMNGRIWVDSLEGHGSTFHFIVELGVGSDESPADQSARPELQGKRALVIDDNQTQLRFLEDLLLSWGVDVSTSKRGEDAATRLEASASRGEIYDLLLLDLQMPGIDGFAVARELNDKRLVNRTKVVLLTSTGLRGDAQCCQELGVSGYLTKPIFAEELRLLLSAVLGQSDGGGIVTRHTIGESKPDQRAA